MFAYCTDSLGLSEHEAYLRITVARATRERPVLLTMLAEGRLHLTGIAKLVPHLTEQNAAALLQKASGRSRLQIEELIASIAPVRDAPSSVRRLPQPEPSTPALPGVSSRPLDPSGAQAATVVAPAVRAGGSASPLQPLSPDRYRVQFTANAGFCAKLDRLRDLLRASIPDGSVEAILDRAVTELVGRLEARRFGLTSKPGASGGARVREPSRHVPMDVRRMVFARDEGRCRFVGTSGQRCPARKRLEFHHVEPYARGGATTVANVQLMCRAHNAHLAERDFGSEHMAAFRKGGTGAAGPKEPSRPPPAAPSRA
jgi:5-methylcytosine-specific restriction endonuclease McrA